MRIASHVSRSMTGGAPIACCRQSGSPAMPALGLRCIHLVRHVMDVGRTKADFELWPITGWLGWSSWGPAGQALLTEGISPIADPDPGLPAFPNVTGDGVESRAKLRIDVLSTFACLTTAWLTKPTPSK